MMYAICSQINLIALTIFQEDIILCFSIPKRALNSNSFISWKHRPNNYVSVTLSQRKKDNRSILWWGRKHMILTRGSFLESANNFSDPK